jgi:uncharacterized protein YbjQ (UPF0145 family)
MSDNLNRCSNCNTEIKSSVFSSSVQKFTEPKIWLTNLYKEVKSDAYCTKCGNEDISIAISKWSNEKESLINSIKKLIINIPIITIQSPQKWEYSIISIVTSQSVLGTGLITEFASSFTDMLGLQSNRFNKKLKEGEDLCFNQLRTEAHNLGANAIIAADIDYSEVGGVKGMLMVCIAGTAINLENIGILGTVINESITQLKNDYQRLKYLQLHGDITLYA